MADRPLPAPETPTENRRRLARDRADKLRPKAPQRSENYRQAKPKAKGYTYGKKRGS